MKYELYSVKDVLSGNVGEIVIMPNEAMARRWFAGLCSESKIKNDLQLYRLGTYNVQTAEIVSAPEFILGGADNA